MRNRYVLLVDVFAVAAAAFGAFALRFDLLHIDQDHGFLPYLVAALCVKPALFLLFGLYRRYWRYTSVPDLGVVLLAAVVAAIAMAGVVAAYRMSGFLPSFSRSIPIIDGMLTFLAIGAVRVGVRLAAESRERGRNGNQNGDAKRVLIVGAGQAGTMVVREMQRNPALGMTPVGYLDDDPAKKGKTIYGLPVVGGNEDLIAAVGRLEVAEVVIAMPTAPGAVVRQIAAGMQSGRRQVADRARRLRVARRKGVRRPVAEGGDYGPAAPGAR